MEQEAVRRFMEESFHKGGLTAMEATHNSVKLFASIVNRMPNEEEFEVIMSEGKAHIQNSLDRLGS